MRRRGDVLLTVGPAPHIHRGRTVRGCMFETLLALVPAAVLAVVHFGLPAARVMCLSVAVAVITEALCFKAMGREVMVDDLSAAVSGLVFAFLLPASAPWWLTAFGSFATIAMGKMIFGGLGANPLGAPLVGWAVLKISWRGLMDTDISMLGSELAAPLSELKYFGLEAVTNTDPVSLLTGEQLGGLGAVQVAALMAGGVYLVLRRRISWIIPACLLAGAAATASIYYFMDSALYPAPLFHLLAGGTVFAAFFLAPEPGPAPRTARARAVFGLFAGALLIVIRVYGVYPDGAPFAVLLAQLAAPLIDRLGPKPFGGA